MRVVSGSRVLIAVVCGATCAASHAESVRNPLAPTDPGADMSFRSDLVMDVVWSDSEPTIEVSICNLGSEDLFLQSYSADPKVLAEPTLVTRNGSMWLSGRRTDANVEGPPVIPFTMPGLPEPADRSRILTVRYAVPEGVTSAEFVNAFMGSSSAAAKLDIDAEIARFTSQGLGDSGHFSTVIVVPLPKSFMAGAACLGGIAFGNLARRRAHRA